VFTLFYNKALNYNVRQPDNHKVKNLRPLTSSNIPSNNKVLNYVKKHYTTNPYIFARGNRKEGLKKLINFEISTYTNNYPSTQTTGLSVYNKFGLISIREFYNVVKSKEELMRQLYWRDFYYYICYHYPEIFTYQHLMRHVSIIWKPNQLLYNNWCNGETGFPFVDAGMRQMNISGYMHNRARLVVANFLIKTLLIDWKKGEQYFSKKLIDIDRCQNISNWNWCASFGLDPTQFIRILNPWLQSIKI
jgi:deoxyribodipyrimidine photo-lyase